MMLHEMYHLISILPLRLQGMLLLQLWITIPCDIKNGSRQPVLGVINTKGL